MKSSYLQLPAFRYPRRLSRRFRIKRYLVFRRHLTVTRAPHREVIHLAFPIANNQSSPVELASVSWTAARGVLTGMALTTPSPTVLYPCVQRRSPVTKGLECPMIAVMRLRHKT